MKEESQDLELGKDTSISLLKEVLNLDSNKIGMLAKLGNVPLGMTSIQIKTFVLNTVEHPTDFSKFVQAKRELWVRYEVLIQMAFDSQKADAEIELLEGEIKDLDSDEDGKNTKVAKIKLKQIEIAQLKFRKISILKSASEKLDEAKAFYEIYEKHQKFDKMSEEELIAEEKEYWLTRILDNPHEFAARYGIDSLKDLMDKEQLKTFMALGVVRDRLRFQPKIDGADIKEIK